MQCNSFCIFITPDGIVDYSKGTILRHGDQIMWQVQTSRINGKLTEYIHYSKSVFETGA